MAQCILGNVPNWIQALAAISIVGLTLITLIVLKHYAADTKTIARASVLQLENSQMPFLAVIMQPNTTHSTGEWRIENQGFGPAINVTYSSGHKDATLKPLGSMPRGDIQPVHADVDGVLGAREACTRGLHPRLDRQG
jgi:hypothetical protein